MNARTIALIVVIGALGAFAFIIAAMIGVGKLAEKPLIRACIEVADAHKVKEVSISLVPPTGPARTLKVGYATSVTHASLDAQAQEMEGVAKSAYEKVRAIETMEDADLKRQGRPVPEHGPVTVVSVRRTWRSDRGCFKRSDEVTHEWTPPRR